MDNCAKCNQELQGISISDKDGWICERCYYILHPFKQYLTFNSVLHNMEVLTAYENPTKSKEIG